MKTNLKVTKFILIITLMVLVYNVNFAHAQFDYEEALVDSEFIGGGVAQGWHADDNSYFYSLPFTFPFNSGYDSVYICTNGFIDFTNSEVIANNQGKIDIVDNVF